ncbi:MAG: hypothetical protein HY698_19815 [Deltaproteobacteria bacterium]|nr:hypothetical protein [Deltaproteobacteria bacterium]
MSKNELEGGFWELSCDDGKRYQVSGGDDGLHQEGIHVEVEGKIDRGAFGIGMTGPTLHVRSYKKI